MQLSAKGCPVPVVSHRQENIVAACHSSMGARESFMRDVASNLPSPGTPEQGGGSQRVEDNGNL